MKDKLRKHYRAGQLSRRNEDAQQKWRMCEARFTLGDFTDFDGWELRDKWAALLWNERPYPLPMWCGGPGLVYVIGEQGLGDEVFFGCYLRPGMVVECDERLIPAMSRAGMLCVPALFNEMRTARYKQSLPAGVEYWVGAGDLMRYSSPRVPYLTADPAQVERFKAYRGRVGVSWRGRLGEYPLHEFARGIERPVSLQYDLEWDEEIEQPDLDLRNDVEGLLGLLANLSRVVTVSTSVAHLAICSGVRTDVVLAPVKAGYNKFPWKYQVYGNAPYASLAAYHRVHL